MREWAPGPADVALLVCPSCRGRLRFEGALRCGRIDAGILVCARCPRRWEVERGLPRLVDEGGLGRSERLFRRLYDTLGFLHDPAGELLLPLLDGSSAREIRDRYVGRLELEHLGPGAGDGPPRILEVGVGSGGNLAVLERELGRGLGVELWGVDLSEGMLRACRRRLARRRQGMRLAMADAHALPFANASFDRVFHTGAIGHYRDPGLGLREMARVARPGTPIVVVDEQLDPSRHHSLARRLGFGALTLGSAAPQAPVSMLPPDAYDVRIDQLSRFYYCLRFRMAGLDGLRSRPAARRPNLEPSTSIRLRRPRAGRRSRPSG